MGEGKFVYRPDYAVPPGETLLEVLESFGMTQAELAIRTGRPSKTINEIVKGKAEIMAETALQFERVLSVPASVWLGLERNYQERLARIKEQKELAQGKEWFDTLPAKRMVEYGWVEDRPDLGGKVREALAFFGVASPKAWSDIWLRPQAAFRESKAFRSEPGAVAAWLRRGELAARGIQCEPHSSKHFRSTLGRVRGLSRLGPAQFKPLLIEACASAGVAVAFIRELPGARLSGATRWLTPDKALIQLSLRYRSDDQLWFTFFHESAHILLHSKQIRLEEENGQTDEEAVANRFAADTLIPAREYKSFTSVRRKYSRADVVAFAERLGIAPGIVVGRLQHDGLVPWGQMNGLKRHLKWAEADRT